jgi:hypothetical protein
MTLPNSRRQVHGVKTIMRGIQEVPLPNSVRHNHFTCCGGNATNQFQNNKSQQYNHHSSVEKTPRIEVCMDEIVKAIRCDMPNLNCGLIATLESLLVEAIQI